MTAQPLAQPVDHAGPIIDSLTIAPLGHAEAGALARVELGRFLALLESLGPEEWERRTMCSAWSVRDILAHQAGAYSAGASFAEFRRQFSQKVPPGRELIDVVNALQIADRAGRAPAELLAELREMGPRAIAARQRLPWLLRHMPMPLPPLGLRPVGYLTDAVFLRDTWSHRVDVSYATGRPPLLSADHDGRFTALIVRDLAPRLAPRLGGATVLLELDGPAGGRFRLGRAAAPAATVALDAIDFHLRASARISAEQALARSRVSGDEALATRALQHTFVLY
ncbi:MAG TPA: maleylpyruvate isomerase family mycothiol-dependent enzyme [Chloroflexaceae bacterium]|nr:maleylpyruvate isomerase family mycothiol-dependent enzyme [Chloroflexaceae bacterium]